MASVKRALTRRVRFENRCFMGCSFLLWGVCVQGPIREKRKLLPKKGTLFPRMEISPPLLYHKRQKNTPPKTAFFGGKAKKNFCINFPVFPPILAFFGGKTRKNWGKRGFGGGLSAQTVFSSPCCPVYRSMRWLALFSSLLLALWPLPLRLQIVGIYDILKSMPAMAGQKALCLKRRRLTPYRHQSTG